MKKKYLEGKDEFIMSLVKCPYQKRKVRVEERATAFGHMNVTGALITEWTLAGSLLSGCPLPICFLKTFCSASISYIDIKEITMKNKEAIYFYM